MKKNIFDNFILKFKLKKLVLKSINNKLDLRYNILFGIMKRINENFKNDIIQQFKYNLYLNRLDSINNKFIEIPRPINKIDLQNIGLKNILDIISTIDSDITKLCSECGTYNIYDLIFIITKLELNNFIEINKNESFNKLLKFYNNVFVPINFTIYTELTLDKYINSDKPKDLTLYDPNVENYDEKSFDLHLLSKIEDLPICKHFKKSTVSIVHSINGARVYFPLKYNNTKIYLVVNGFFNEDPLNLSRYSGTIGSKNQKLLLLINKININEKFKYAYIEQLSLRDFIIYDNNTIIDKCIDSYNELLKLKEKTISSLVKDFLLSNTEKQRHILTLFLLSKDDVETQYLAHLMYDMISNESYLLKPQPLAEQVYNSLHWSIKKLFKVAIKRVSDYTKKILNFNEESIPYEKRICLLKAPDYVKAKAMEKYKEISNKTNDNTSKSQQYLDGLLRIPFGIYKKENIINFLSDFKININHFIQKIISEITQSNNEFMCDINQQVIELCLKYDNIKLTSNNINEFLSKLKLITNNLLKELIPEKDEDIKILLNKFDKKKIYDYKKFINFINKDLINDEKIIIKGRKKDLKQLVYNHILTCNNKELKNKYVLYLKNQERNIDDIINIINVYFESLIYKTNIYCNQWNIYQENKINYIKNIEKTLDKAVYGQDQAKLEIKRIIAQWINGEMKGYVFGFEGPPGTGKTSLAKKGIAQCLKDENNNPRPFSFVALGGSSNGSTLEGHSFTYVGSTWGKIADILIESKCMNPIIFIDELDKVSKTEHGREIIGILTHITDPSQNDEYCDKYFAGVKLDLSKALFIFSYNDYSLIDPILADRIHRVKFNQLSKNDKIHIINNYLLPELLETVGFSKEDLTFDDNVVEYIISNYTFEAGIRKLKEKVFEIVRELNLRNLIGSQNYNVVTIETIQDIFSKKPKMIIKKIATKPHIGLVNGLYATSCGIGGLTIIETFKTPSDSKLSLILTGQQGDVMQESVKCAKTIAWNLIPSHIKSSIKKEWDENGSYGIHVHCPEAATPKDGPSAGAAITLAIVSLLCNIPVKNTIAMTGEIDLNGSVHAIGGLDFKIDGGKIAGANHILCPKNNSQDLDIIKKDKPDILENIKVTCIDNIWQVLELALENNNIKFNNYLQKV